MNEKFWHSIIIHYHFNNVAPTWFPTYTEAKW